MDRTTHRHFLTLPPLRLALFFLIGLVPCSVKALTPLPPGNEPTYVGMEGTLVVTVQDTTLTVRDTNTAAAPNTGTGATRMLPPLRISAVNRLSEEGRKRTYEIKFIGLRAGEHNLLDYLTLSEGVNVQMIAPMLVRVTDPLPINHDGHLEKLDSSNISARSLPRYALWIGGGVWVIGLGIIGYRHWRKLHPKVQRVPAGALEDEFPQMLRLAEAKRLTPNGMAKLERMLLEKWRHALGYGGVSFAEAYRALQEDERGRLLLEAFANWQHRLETAPTPLPALLRESAAPAELPATASSTSTSPAS